MYGKDNKFQYIYLNNFSSDQTELISGMKTIEPYAAGRFYPSDAHELQADVQQYTEVPVLQPQGIPVGLIVPHAGYVFSGKTAGKGYALLRNRPTPEICFLLAPSHRRFLSKPTICKSGGLVSPLGVVKTKTDIINELLEHKNIFDSSDEAFVFEHAIEVQLPFLQFLFPKSLEIVPILFSDCNKHTLEAAANILSGYLNEKNLFIISSDFSHYPDYNLAQTLDAELKDAIVNFDIAQFENLVHQNKHLPGVQTRACGSSSISAWLYACKSKSTIHAEAIDYSNSGDSEYSRSKKSVVGYYSIAFTLSPQ